jgi:hypothetical protein
VRKGDKVMITHRRGSGWLYGYNPLIGEKGCIPMDYVSVDTKSALVSPGEDVGASNSCQATEIVDLHVFDDSSADRCEPILASNGSDVLVDGRLAFSHPVLYDVKFNFQVPF